MNSERGTKASHAESECENEEKNNLTAFKDYVEQRFKQVVQDYVEQRRKVSEAMLQFEGLCTVKHGRWFANNPRTAAQISLQLIALHNKIEVELSKLMEVELLARKRQE